MKYLRMEDNRVLEIIPEFDPVFPNIPLDQRYAPDFISRLLPVEDNVEVEQNWLYSAEEQTFTPPPIEIGTVEPDMPPEEPGQPHQPTQGERIAALEDALAQTDETAIELYEAQAAQETVNAQQDEALLELYEQMGV